MIGPATADLVRAALISAVDEEPVRGDRDQNLITVVKGYITQHLADPGLGAERIAQAMFISVRQVYKLWENEPGPLGQWIVERRLEAARRELTSPRGRNQTIAAIARRWGFADSTHFSRRFRQAYGMSPREWRHGIRPRIAGNPAQPASTLRPISATLMHVETVSDRGVMLLIQGLWFHPSGVGPVAGGAGRGRRRRRGAVLGGGDPQSGDGSPAARADFDALLAAARRRVDAFRSSPTVIGHGVGGAVGGAAAQRR